MSYHVTFTYYTPKSLVSAYANSYSHLRNKYGLDVIARNIDSYNILENLKVNNATDFFADSELLYPFWFTNRGKEFLKTKEGYLYLQTDEGQKYMEKYGYEHKGINNRFHEGFVSLPKLIIEKQSDYDNVQKLWLK